MIEMFVQMKREIGFDTPDPFVEIVCRRFKKWSETFIMVFGRFFATQKNVSSDGVLYIKSQCQLPKYSSKC